MKQWSESQFQSQVENLAAFYGWAHYHAPDNKPGANGRRQTVKRGWPDLVLLRDGELIFAELKAETGRVRPEQSVWLEGLAQVPGVETYVWRPSDFDELHSRLAQGRHKTQPLYRTEAA